MLFASLVCKSHGQRLNQYNLFRVERIRVNFKNLFIHVIFFRREIDNYSQLHNIYYFLIIYNIVLCHRVINIRIIYLNNDISF